jgi:hypothetical protein
MIKRFYYDTIDTKSLPKSGAPNKAGKAFQRRTVTHYEHSKFTEKKVL